MTHKILFLAANPIGADRLALDEEARAIRVALERSGLRDRFELETRWAARPGDLLDELRKLRPTIVHFSGHGGRQEPSASADRGERGPRRDFAVEKELLGSVGLYFTGRDGRPQRVSSEALRQTFGAAGSSVRVVVLNACYSSAQADVLRGQVECVVGMGGAVGDEAALDFAVGFYGGLGEGESISRAFEQGRAAISLEGLRDSDCPQLHVRAGVDAGRLVLAVRGEVLAAASSEHVAPSSSGAARAPTISPTASPASRTAPASPTSSTTSPGWRPSAPTEQTMSWTQADVVILTALELEYAAVKRVDAGAVPGSRWVDEKLNGLPVALREFVGTGDSRLRVLLARAPDMGKAAALTTLQPLVDALQPRCIAMCGVCAGRAGKTALGDVVVAERLYDYDAGKWTDSGFQADVRTYSLPAPWKIAAEQINPKAWFGAEAWWQERPVPYEWQEAWVLMKLGDGVEQPSKLPDWKVRCPQWEAVVERLLAAGDVKGKKLTPKGKKRAGELSLKYPEFPDLSPGGTFLPFRLHVKPIASGSAVREDDGVWGFVTPHMRTALALEMEASALADLVRARAHHAPVDAVVMKGVMDFANHGRDDHFKDYAARASAECLIAFLRERLRGAAGSDPRGSSGGSSLPAGGIDARIASARDQLATALSGSDRVAAALATRIGCPGKDVVDRLLTGMSAADLANHWVEVSDHLPKGPDRRRDLEALHGALDAVLPYIADWRADLEAGLASPGKGRVIVPQFASLTVAEAIMAGLYGRQCQFMHHPDLGPGGVAMVGLPSAAQTALFQSRDGSRLLEAVVAQLVEQLRVERSGDPDLDRRRVNNRLRTRAAGLHDEEPLHYYFVYQDTAVRRARVLERRADDREDSPGRKSLPASLDAAWELVVTSLDHPKGLPHLALVRMQGHYDDDELQVESLVKPAHGSSGDRGEAK